MTFVRISIEFLAGNIALERQFLHFTSLRYLRTVILFQVAVFFQNHIINKVRLERIFSFFLSLHLDLSRKCIYWGDYLLLNLIRQVVMLVNAVQIEISDVGVDSDFTSYDADLLILTSLHLQQLFTLFLIDRFCYTIPFFYLVVLSSSHNILYQKGSIAWMSIVDHRLILEFTLK